MDFLPDNYDNAGNKKNIKRDWTELLKTWFKAPNSSETGINKFLDFILQFISHYMLLFKAQVGFYTRWQWTQEGNPAMTRAANGTSCTLTGNGVKSCHSHCLIIFWEIVVECLKQAQVTPCHASDCHFVFSCHVISTINHYLTWCMPIQFQSTFPHNIYTYNSCWWLHKRILGDSQTTWLANMHWKDVSYHINHAVAHLSQQLAIHKLLKIIQIH